MNNSHIDLKKIRHLAVLARVGSFIAAADELHITQSALTRSIQALEAQLGIRLFDRARSGVRLTAVGRIFLERAQELLVDADELARFAQQVKKVEKGPVAFGLSALPAKLFLAPLVLQLFEEKPEVQCSVAVRSPEELLELLQSDKIEFYLGIYAPSTSTVKLEIAEIAQVETTLVVRKGHPLLDQGTLTLRDIEPYPLLVSLFEVKSLSPAPYFSAHHQTFATDDYSAAMRIALHSDAVWLSSMLKHRNALPDPGLALLSVSMGRTLAGDHTLKSIKLARRTLSPMADHVLEMIRQRCLAATPAG